jgi:hypothetical protein
MEDSSAEPEPLGDPSLVLSEAKDTAASNFFGLRPPIFLLLLGLLTLPSVGNKSESTSAVGSSQRFHDVGAEGCDPSSSTFADAGATPVEGSFSADGASL